MNRERSQLELEAFLDEALSPQLMADIERELRDDATLRQRLVEIHRRRDVGVHSVGEIWRRHRVSCATREELGSYLLGAMSPARKAALELHVSVAQCRLCQANLEDLRLQQKEHAEAVAGRRRRYFESSAGYLKKRD